MDETNKSTSRATEISPETLFTHTFHQDENRLTKAFLHVVDVCGFDFLSYMEENLGLPLPKRFLEISCQIREAKKNEYTSIPDGKIRILPLTIIIESKLWPNSINPKQLESHLSQLAEEDMLLYITSDAEKPKILEEKDVLWQSWKDIFETVNKYRETHPEYAYIIDGFISVYDEIYNKQMPFDPERTAVVLGGAYGEGHALAHNQYHCQPNREFKGVKYMAFYTHKRIAYIYKIISGPEQVQFEMGPQTLYKLELFQDRSKNPIINDKKDKNGKPTPFTMGSPRYVDIDKLLTAKVTTELENK